MLSVRSQASDDLVSLGDLVLDLVAPGRRFPEQPEGLLQSLTTRRKRKRWRAVRSM
jgi:hypothetical protein